MNDHTLPQPRIALLILGYNHQSHLRNLFDSVAKQHYSNCKVFYIDNASTDDSVNFVANNYSFVTIEKNTENLGYAKAYDIAIRNAFKNNFDACVLLNPDTIVDPYWLLRLTDSAYTDSRIALAQSKILLWESGPTDRINTFGNVIHFLGFGYCGHYKERDDFRFTTDRDIVYGSGAALLIKKEYYGDRDDQICFDTDYFAYLEDQDLGWQAKILGLRTIASSQSIVYHHYDFDKAHLNGFKFYLLERNRLFFLLKFFEFKTLFLIFPAFFIMDIGVVLDSIAKGYFLSKIKSEWHFITKLRTTLIKRKHVQQTRKVSDKELFQQLAPIVSFEAVDSPLMRLANAFLNVYYSVIRKIL